MDLQKKNTSTPPFKTDIPIATLVVLALLTVPRAIVHDLRLLAFDSLAYGVLAVTPWIVWLFVAVLRRNKKPVQDFLILGVLFGLFLALTHQILWSISWGENLPRLGGNLEGALDPAVEIILMRTAAFISSLFTGVAFGVGFALVAWVVAKIRRVV